MFHHKGRLVPRSLITKSLFVRISLIKYYMEISTRFFILFTSQRRDLSPKQSWVTFNCTNKLSIGEVSSMNLRAHRDAFQRGERSSFFVFSL